MPNRILREGILTSERLALLAWPEEVFYRRLMSVVDDFGRYYAHPGLLRAALYPLQIDKVSDSDIGKWLTACVTAALVRVYPAPDGKRYLELLDFRQQVRARESRFPPFDPQLISACDTSATQVLRNGAAHAPVFGDVSVDGGDARRRARRPPTSAMPDDFAVSAKVAEWARAKGFTRLDEHLDAFRRKCQAKAYVYADWDAAFMEAVREDWAKLRIPSARSSGDPFEGAH